MKEIIIKSKNKEFYENVVKNLPKDPVAMYIRLAAESQEWSTHFLGLEDNNPIFQQDFNVSFVYDRARDFFIPRILNHREKLDRDDASYILENFHTAKPYIVEYGAGLNDKGAYIRFRNKLLTPALNVGYHINNGRLDLGYEEGFGITSSLSIDANSKQCISLSLFNDKSLDERILEENQMLKDWFLDLKKKENPMFFFR
ncbi:MAG: hypothetical protein PHT94_03775 [Candidatus Nanoarchaeia archaeon]|nr:hypothetical protein [Candidatus Nanoarchaeia archaeon]